MEPSFAAKLPGWFHGFFGGMAGSKHDEPTHMKIIGLYVQLCELPPDCQTCANLLINWEVFGALCLSSPGSLGPPRRCLQIATCFVSPGAKWIRCYLDALKFHHAIGIWYRSCCCTWGVIIYESPRNTTLCERGHCGGVPGNLYNILSSGLCIPLDLVCQFVLPGGTQMARAWLFGWLIWVFATVREVRQTPSEYQTRYDASTSTTKPEHWCI